VIEYLFVGAIAGFGIFLILSIICGIFDNKIYSADDMAINYNIAPLGKFAVKNKKYRSKFDRYIDKLFNINTPVITALNGDKITKAAQENSTSKLIIVALTEEEKEVIKEKSAIAGYELTEEFSPDADRKEFIIKRFDEVNDTDFTAPLSVIVAVNYGTAKFGALNRVFIELERLSANVIGFVGIENIEE
ncbi:MAG: hypothetical protein KBS41_04750, partial [Oscillospiraceae bacterium]|nr:hypothetical protein [Candidatus Equicaccousia limihippi]